MHAPCDRWDVRGHAVTSHPDTGRLTVFFYDAQPAGAGFTEQAFTAADAWFGAALDRVRACGCANGCPACVVAADCAATQVGLDKTVAAELLALLQTPAIA